MMCPLGETRNAAISLCEPVSYCKLIRANVARLFRFGKFAALRYVRVTSDDVSKANSRMRCPAARL